MATGTPCSCCLDWAAAIRRPHLCAGCLIASATAPVAGISAPSVAAVAMSPTASISFSPPKRETGPVSLVGWSLGGAHAIDLARRRPRFGAVDHHAGKSSHRSPPTARDPDYFGVQPHRRHRPLARITVAVRVRSTRTSKSAAVISAWDITPRSPSSSPIVSLSDARPGNRSRRLAGLGAGCLPPDESPSRHSCVTGGGQHGDTRPPSRHNLRQTM